MVKFLLKVLAIAASGVLGACGSGGGDAPVSQSPSMIVKGSAPAELYSHIAKQVRACWLNPADPVLTKHIFRAQAGAGGPSGSATNIVIYEQTKDFKRGLKAFSIDFKPLRDGTQLSARNHRLSYTLAQKLNSDIGYWVQGGVSCDGPAAGVALRGSVSGPRVSR